MLVINIKKEVRRSCMFFPEMNIYKKCSEKNTCMYFMKKDEKILDKDMAIWKKVSNITKKSNNQLYKKTKSV